MSGRPSPSTSPTATAMGEVSVLKSSLVSKDSGRMAPPRPAFWSTDTLCEARLAVTRSRWPSPFRSAAATSDGVLPVS